jgi:hypothetical protein
VLSDRVLARVLGSSWKGWSLREDE